MQSATGSQLDVSLSNEAFGGSTVLVHASASRLIGPMVDPGLKVCLTLRRPTASGRWPPASSRSRWSADHPIADMPPKTTLSQELTTSLAKPGHAFTLYRRRARPAEMECAGRFKALGDLARPHRSRQTIGRTSWLHNAALHAIAAPCRHAFAIGDASSLRRTSSNRAMCSASGISSKSAFAWLDWWCGQSSQRR
jgi:hypothetical protein